MEQPATAIERFFKAFEGNNSAWNIPALVAQFADVFMVAGPQGTQCVRAADLALALPRRKQLFDSFGCRSTELVSLNESRLDARYVMAKAKWQMNLVRKDGDAQRVLADSDYIVDTSAEALKIVFYLTSLDHMALMKEHGILPG